MVEAHGVLVSITVLTNSITVAVLEKLANLQVEMVL